MTRQVGETAVSEVLALCPRLVGEALTVEGRLADIIEADKSQIWIDDYRLSDSDSAKVVAALRLAASESGRLENHEGIRWARVNDEPFEYAIQEGPFGDEFVKLLNGKCLRRAVSDMTKDRKSK